MTVIYQYLKPFNCVQKKRSSCSINNEKDKYLDLARELKKLWNMIPIVIGGSVQSPENCFRD